MVQKDSLLILGHGGYGRMVAEAAAATGAYHHIAFLDDTPGEGVLGMLADYAQFSAQYACMLPAFGNNALRRTWLDKLGKAGVRVPNVLHPAAYISPTAKLGQGVVVLPHATVQGGAQIADGCIINVNAVADHDCVLESCVHLAPGAIVKAAAHVAAQTKIESGTVVQREGAI